MSEGVPEGWTSTKLGQILEDIADGGTPATSNRDYYDGDISWVVIDDIRPQIFHTKSKISKLGLEKSSAKLWETGTIILSTGATIGKVGIAMRPMATKQGICGLVPSKSAFNIFLFHYLSYIEHDLNVLAQGSTIKETRPPTIKRISLNLPPLPEQKKIAAILTSVDEVIEATQKQIDKLQDLKKATMNELLTKGIGHTEFKDSELGRIPKSWEVVRVEDIIKKIESGWSPECYPEPASGDNWGVLKTTSVSWDGFEISENKRLPENLIGRPNISLVADDVLVTRAGPIDRVGVIAHCKKTYPLIMLSDKIIRLQTDAAVVLGEFLAIWLASHCSQRELKSKISGMAQAQSNISQDILKNLTVVLPSIAEQEEIICLISSITNAIYKTQVKLAQTQALKKSLMQDLLTGKVRVKVD